jgi:hypothetical protein
MQKKNILKKLILIVCILQPMQKSRAIGPKEVFYIGAPSVFFGVIISFILNKMQNKNIKKEIQEIKDTLNKADISEIKKKAEILEIAIKNHKDATSKFDQSKNEKIAKKIDKEAETTINNTKKELSALENLHNSLSYKIKQSEGAIDYQVKKVEAVQYNCTKIASQTIKDVEKEAAKIVDSKKRELENIHAAIPDETQQQINNTCIKAEHAFKQTSKHKKDIEKLQGKCEENKASNNTNSDKIQNLNTRQANSEAQIYLLKNPGGYNYPQQD